MVLSAYNVKELCKNPGKNKKPLISNWDDSIFKNNPAKVELRLGDYCYCSRNACEIIDLKKQKKVVIKPNEIFLFQTFERINMPKNLSGRMSLKMGLVSKGLLMPNLTQVDPGYSNVLFGMLYNLSSNEIELQYQQAITTLEFADTQIDQNSSYSGTMATMTFEKFVSSRITSSLGTLAREVEESKENLNKSTKMWNFIMTGISVAIGIVAAIVAVTSIISVTNKNAAISVLEHQVDALEKTIEIQSSQMKEYERELDCLVELIEAKIVDSENSEEIRSIQSALG